MGAMVLVARRRRFGITHCASTSAHGRRLVSLQPSPVLSAIGGIAGLGSEYEVHGCLLHAATGQIVPEALRGHVRSIASVGDEQTVTFAEITVMAKPPSLARCILLVTGPSEAFERQTSHIRLLFPPSVEAEETRPH